MKRKKMMGMLLTAAMVTGSMASAFTCMAADEKPYVPYIMGWDFMHRMSKKTIIVHLPISSKELKLQDVVIMTGSIPFCFLILPVFII